MKIAVCFVAFVIGKFNFKTSFRLFFSINKYALKLALCTTDDKWYVKKLKFKITVYFVTRLHKMILNIVSSKL